MLPYFFVLVCLVAVSLVPFAHRRRTPEPLSDTGVGRYGRPPPGWPDVPVEALELFRPTGRINSINDRKIAPQRVATFGEAERSVLSLVGAGAGSRPKITMRLCPEDPEWIDVVLDGKVAVQLPVCALIARPAA